MATSETSSSRAETDRTGLAAGLFCYTAWGLLPVLLHMAGAAGAAPFEIVGWRTLWSIPFALAIVAVTRGFGQVRSVLASPRSFAVLVVSAALIAANWSLYVWAVTSAQVLAASLGYYINPLLNIAVGALVFRERIGPAGLVAIGLATCGVALQAAALGAFPWLSIGLALSFTAYGVVRKRAVADAQTGLLIECLVLSVPAALYVGWLAHTGAGRFGHAAWVTGWLFLTGPATVAPLFAFAVAARRLPLTVLGFLQFIGPTLQFAFGVASGEPLTPLRIVSFVFIWAGVAVFAAGALRGRSGESLPATAPRTPR